MLPYSETPKIDSFAEQLLNYLDAAGAINKDASRWTTMYGPSGEFARFTFAQSEHGAPITLDLAPGLESGFGNAIEMLHDSGWRSIFGPEVIGRERRIGGEKQIVPEVVDPYEAFTGYLTAAWQSPRLHGLYGKGPQELFGYGLFRGMKTGAGAGGLFMYGPGHSEIARSEFTQRLRVGWEGDYQSVDMIYERITQTARHWAETDPTNPMAQLMGYGLYKEKSGAASLRPFVLGVRAPTGGEYDWQAIGVSRQGQSAVQSASEMVKRYPIGFGLSGIRETGFPMEQTGEHTLDRSQPTYISSSPESAGYKWLNAILPGETERRAAYVRPNMAFTSASPVSGQAILYGPTGLPPGQIAYEKHEQIALPKIPVQDLANVNVQLGIMKRVPGEKGAPDTYEQIHPFENYTIEPRTSAIVGTISYTHKGEEIVQPITMKAGPTPTTLEKAHIALPFQYNTATGEPLRHLEEPGTPGVGSGGAVAMRMGANISMPVYATSRSDPYLQITYAQGAYTSIKAFDTKQIPSEIEVPFGTESASLGPTVRGRRISGVSGELKGGIGHFTGHFAGMTPQQQIAMLGELSSTGDSGHALASQAMVNYARMLYQPFLSGQVAEEPPIDMNVMTQIYSHYTGTPMNRATATLMMSDLRSAVMRPGNREAAIDKYGYGLIEPQWYPWSYMSRESYGEVARTAVQGANLWLNEQKKGMTLHTPEGRAFFKETFGGSNIPSILEREFSRFVPQGDEPVGIFGQEGPMGYAEFRGPALLGSMVGGFTPEYQSQMPRLGQLERAALAMYNPQLAREAGIDVSLGPRAAADAGTGIFPEHAMGWEELGNVIRRNVPGEIRTNPGENALVITPEFADEMQLTLAAQAGGTPDYEAQQWLVEQFYGPDTEGKVFYNPETGVSFPRPIAMQRIESSKFPEESPFYDPLSTLSRLHNPAFSQFLSGKGSMEPGDKESAALYSFMNEGLSIFEEGKGVDKLIKSVMLAGGSGGRYSGRFGMGAGNTLVQDLAFSNILSGTATAGGLSGGDVARFVAGNREAVVAAGRVPGFLHRDPSITTEGAVQPTWLVHVQALKNQGVVVPEGTRFRGGKVVGGSPFESNLPFSSGFDLLAMTGDWDADQGLIALIAKVNPDLSMNILRSKELASALGLTQRHLVGLQEELMKRQFGEDAGVPGGAMNVLADAWSSIIGGVERGYPHQPMVSEIPVSTMHRQAWATAKATSGMGVAYNLRRMLQSSAASMMMGPDVASSIHTSGALFYQEYLDKMTRQIMESGGLRRVETMLNTATWAANTSEDPLKLIAMPGPEQKFTTMLDEFSGGGRMRTFLTGALEDDLQDLSQTVGMEYPAGLLAMRGEHIPVLQGFMEETGSVSAGMYKYKDWLAEEGQRLGIGPIEYDATRSVLGNAMVMAATFRASGALGRQPRLVETATGTREPSMNILGSKQFTYQGEKISVRSLSQDPRMVAAETAQAFLTHQGIITPRMIHTVAGLVSELEQTGRPVPYVFQGIMGTFGGEKYAKEYADAARNFGYEPEDRQWAGAIQTAGQIIKKSDLDVIRASSLAYIGETFGDDAKEAARRGTMAHEYMAEYVRAASASGELAGITGVEVSKTRHGIEGTADTTMMMAAGPFAGKEIGVDLKTGHRDPSTYRGQMSAYEFVHQLAAMNILHVPRERVAQIRKDVFTLARQERAGTATPPHHQTPTGWKFHLATDQPDIVSEQLRDMGYIHKVGRAGDQEGKDVTVYIGNKVNADKAAVHIQEELGDLLKDPYGDVLQDDREFTPRVWGRFDANDPEFHQYGSQGIPYLWIDQQRMLAQAGNQLFANQAGGPPMTPELARQRAHARLTQKFGTYYTGERQPLSFYREEVGRRIWQEGWQHPNWMAGEDIGPGTLQTYLEQLAGSMDINLSPVALPEPASAREGIPSGLGTVVTSNVVNMTPEGVITNLARRAGLYTGGGAGARGTGGATGGTGDTGGGNRGGGGTTTGGEQEQPEPGGFSYGDMVQAFAEAFQQTGIGVNVAHHSYTKSIASGFRAAFQAIRNTQEYMGQIPGTDVSLTNLWSERWGPDIAGILGTDLGSVSQLDAASMIMRASTEFPNEFRQWVGSQRGLAEQIQKSVGRPIEVSRGNLSREVRDMLSAAGLDPSIVDQLAGMSSERNYVGASVTAAGLVSDFAKTELAGGRSGSRLGRLIPALDDAGEAITKFQASVENVTVEMKNLQEVMKKEGPESPAYIAQEQRVREALGGVRMAKGQMFAPAARENFEDAVSAAMVSPTPQNMQAVYTAADDLNAMMGDILQGGAEARGIQGKPGRFMRGLIGGWGLMYMSRIAKFPLSQAGYGLAEADQYQAQMAQYAGGLYGGGISPYDSVSNRILESQINYAGQGMAAWETYQAGMSAGQRDLQGMGLAALAGGAGALYVGGEATKAGMKVLGARISGAAPLVALGAALGYGYMQIRAAQAQPLTTAGTAMGARLQPEETWAWSGHPGAGRLPNVPTLMNRFTAWWREKWGMTQDTRTTYDQALMGLEGYLQNQGPVTASGKNLLGMMTQEEFMMASQPYVTGQIPEQMQGLDPALKGQTWARIGEWSTIEQMDASVWAQMRGIDTPGLAQGLMKAARQSYSQADAAALENLITAQKQTVAEAGQLQSGYQIMNALPIAMLERLYGRGYGTGAQAILDTGSQLGEWGETDYGEMIMQQGALQTQALQRGLGQMNLPGLDRRMDRIRQGTATRAEIRETANIMTRDEVSQNIAAGIGYYLPQMEQAVYQTVYQDDQAAQRYAAAQEMMPQAQMLGISELGFMTQMAGRGTQGALLGERAVGLTRKYALWGGTQTDQFFDWSSASLGNQVMAERLMSFDPLGFADAAMGYGGMTPIPSMGQFAQTVDVGLGGQLTGLSWGTTSLASVGRTGAQNANAIFGSAWQGTDWGKALVQGWQNPYGKTWAGTRGLGWMMREKQWEAQQASLGAAYAQVALQEEYMPKFWAIQDQQRALQHEQALWGFEMQGRQFTMQGRQFQENMGLQRRGQLMQRGWAQEDWAYQDQMRTMQWGWRQEDFAENVRFMTGRERKLAERQMERETIMYGMEGERIDTQRERQKEMWSLEDQRFELSKKHFQEQRQLQEENMKKQREFYDEGKKLQDEMIKLQREYQLKQLELQKAAIGAQAKAAEEMKKAQDAMQAVAEEAADRAGEFALAKSRQVDMINTIVKGMNHLITNIPGVFVAMGKALIPLFKSGGGAGGGGGPNDYYQTGGPTMPGELSFVGESGIEAIRSSVPQHVFPTNETFAAVMGGNDKLISPWEETIISNMKDSTGGTQRPTTIIVNIGNERLGEFVLNTVNDALEVR